MNTYRPTAETHSVIRKAMRSILPGPDLQLWRPLSVNNNFELGKRFFIIMCYKI
jgi:hypothetical protein